MEMELNIVSVRCELWKQTTFLYLTATNTFRI